MYHLHLIQTTLTRNDTVQHQRKALEQVQLGRWCLYEFRCLRLGFDDLVIDNHPCLTGQDLAHVVLGHALVLAGIVGGDLIDPQGPIREHVDPRIVRVDLVRIQHPHNFRPGVADGFAAEHGRLPVAYLDVFRLGHNLRFAYMRTGRTDGRAEKEEENCSVTFGWLVGWGHISIRIVFEQ